MVPSDLKYFVHDVLGAAKTNPFFSFNQRSFDQDWLIGHSLQDGFIIGVEEAQFLGRRTSRSQTLAGSDPRALVERSQRFDTWSGLQIFNHRQFDTVRLL